MSMPFALPWNDRAGRLSGLKLAAFALCIAPGAWLLARWWTVGLGSKPLTFAIHHTGDWAVRFLLLSLLVTPLRALADWPRLIAVRRMVGVTALAYVLLHLGLYVAEQGYDLVKVVSEIALRFYLTIGFIALIGLIALGVTSTDAMTRRLGAPRWNRLHALTYALTFLALLHFFLQRRLDVSEPVLMAGLFLWLMGYRLLARRKAADNIAVLLALAAAAALAAMALEGTWYALRNGAPLLRVLAANLDFSFTIRPAWWVLLAGLAMAALSVWRGRPRRRLKDRSAPDETTARAAGNAI
jgi:sulfoxide reductase heme-binding subunit YedZ